MSDSKKDEISQADTAFVLRESEVALIDESGSLQSQLATLEVSSSPGSPAPAPSKLASRYEILALLGAGAMGSVYRARDAELDELVALKMLRADLIQSAAMLELFRREVKLSRRIAHPNVARVFDIGEHDGRKFLTMELIEGESLRELFERAGRFDTRRAIEIGLGICAGLEAAHAAGVVHRDLKPDNVMIVRVDGRPVVMDFGIARAVASAGDATATTGTMVGTPAYMAPEQVEAARDIDGRADLYAFGAMLFELVTGRLPFEGDSALAVAAKRLTTAAPDVRAYRPELPEALAFLLHRCLARLPSERFESARELSQALAELQSIAPAEPSRPARRNPTHDLERDRSVAVLPLFNQGPAEDDYIAGGLTEDLVDNLSTTRGLRVRPLGTASRFAGAEVDPCEAGRELGVEVVVSGSVRRRGAGLRITARVVSVADGFQLWMERFDCTTAEVFRVSDELTAAVAKSLTVSAGAAPRAAAVDPIAIELYLRGRAQAGKLGYTPLLEAVQLLQESHERLPEDPKILVALARAVARLSFFVTDPSDGARIAEQMAGLLPKVESLAPDLPEANSVRAYIRFSEGDFAAAFPLVMRALAKAPALVEAHELRGRILVETGPVERGLESLERALFLDPSLENIAIERARVLGMVGRAPEAEGVLLASSDTSHSVAMTLVARFLAWGLPIQTSLDVVRRELASGPAAGPRMLLAFALDVLEQGRVSPEAQQTLHRIADTPGRPPRGRAFMYQILTELHLAVGEIDAAMDALSLAVDAGFIDWVWCERCPLLERAHAHPRFATLARRIRERAEVVQRLELAPTDSMVSSSRPLG
ncbi:MAG: protein kinase [Polyangiaceae bacterium]|nr:protein kinase [Polyangiaceae bacterium]